MLEGLFQVLRILSSVWAIYGVFEGSFKCSGGIFKHLGELSSIWGSFQAFGGSFQVYEGVVKFQVFEDPTNNKACHCLYHTVVMDKVDETNQHTSLSN